MHRRLRYALDTGDFESLPENQPIEERDALLTLLTIYDLWLAPIDTLQGKEKYQNHPQVARLKWRLDEWLIGALDRRTSGSRVTEYDTAQAVRRIARQANDSIYDWLAASADWDQLVTFMAIEGGPDGGFDDLVAIAQVGLHDGPKVVLGKNYWDEMGRGELAEVHTVLHDRLVAAVDMPRVDLEDLPVSALYRSALNGLLATNRCLQPEMLGALGLLELQAGPRCRRMVEAFNRLGAPKDAFPFYQEHAQTDPRHGKEWLEEALMPLVEQHPDWHERIVRGARWRADVNARLFRDVHTLLATRELQTA
jgi:hypothetical protein